MILSTHTDIGVHVEVEGSAASAESGAGVMRLIVSDEVVAVGSTRASEGKNAAVGSQTGAG